MHNVLDFDAAKITGSLLPDARPTGQPARATRMLNTHIQEHGYERSMYPI